MRESYFEGLFNQKGRRSFTTPFVFLFALVLKQIKSELTHFSFCEAANHQDQAAKA